MRADYLINKILDLFRYLARINRRMRMGATVDDLNGLMKSLEWKITLSDQRQLFWWV